MRERRELYPEGESPSIPKPEVIPNSVLDDPKLFDLQSALNAYPKEFSFTIFGRTFKFETYVKKEVHRIAELVEPCQSSAQAAFICKHGQPDPIKDKANLDYLLEMPDIEYLEKRDKFLKQLQKDTEQLMYPNLNKNVNKTI